MYRDMGSLWSFRSHIRDIPGGYTSEWEEIYEY